jgi:hypothetical protein
LPRFRTAENDPVVANATIRILMVLTQSIFHARDAMQVFDNAVTFVLVDPREHLTGSVGQVTANGSISLQIMQVRCLEDQVARDEYAHVQHTQSSL